MGTVANSVTHCTSKMYGGRKGGGGRRKGGCRRAVHALKEAFANTVVGDPSCYLALALFEEPRCFVHLLDYSIFVISSP